MILPEKKLSTGRAQVESMARPITRRLEQPPNTSTNLHCIGATSDICPDVCLQENGRTCERCCEFCTINGPIKVIEFCMAKNSHFYFIFCTFGASQLAGLLACLVIKKIERKNIDHKNAIVQILKYVHFFLGLQSSIPSLDEVECLSGKTTIQQVYLLQFVLFNASINFNNLHIKNFIQQVKASYIFVYL